MFFSILKESVFFFFALFTAIISWRKANSFFKLLSLQLALFFIVYAGGYVITFYQQARNLPQNNIWIYNLYFPIECALLAAAALQLLQSKMIRMITLICYFLFLTFYMIQIARFGLNHFANFAVAAYAFILVGLYLAVLYHILKTPGFTFRAFPQLWACLGIALYFGCIVPYFSVMNYLHATNPKLNSTLFFIINNVLSHVRYFATAISMILFYQQRTNVMLQ
jgi:hypothetical protein